MANFSSLKQAIQNYIKENGNKEITGNLLQEILLSMVVTMGDNAINSLTTVVNELNTILHSVDAEPTKNSVNLVRSGGVWSGINREALRAFNAETFEARFNSTNNRVEFFNQSGDMLYWYDASAFVTTGLVEDVYIENDNLVFVINTSAGEKTIEVPLEDVFNPNNYYTKTQIDDIVRTIRELYDGAEYRGFITPSSQAESKQGVKMVCFATEAGTYTNFLANYDTPIVIPVRGIWVFERGVDADDWTAYSLLEIDKVYAPAQASGMGRVVLQKNMVNGVNTLTQDMFYKGEVGSRVPNTNTIFVIEYDFILGEDITVPANCVLEFDGGSISGAYTLTGVDTYINAGMVKIFNTNITLAGSWNVTEAYPEWFDAKGDGVTLDDTPINKAVSYFDKVCFTKTYFTNGDIKPHSNSYLYGNGTILNNHVQGIVLIPNNGNNITVEGLTFRHVGDEEGKYYVVKDVVPASNITVRNIKCYECGIILMNGTYRDTSTYHKNITIVGNTAEMKEMSYNPRAKNPDCIFLAYCSDFIVSGNRMKNFTESIVVWGGDGRTYDWYDVENNEPIFGAWNGVINNNVMIGTLSGVFLALNYNVVVDGNTIDWVDGEAVDAEWCRDIVFSDNTIHNTPLGLCVYGWRDNIRFDNNSIECNYNGLKHWYHDEHIKTHRYYTESLSSLGKVIVSNNSARATDNSEIFANTVLSDADFINNTLLNSQFSYCDANYRLNFIGNTLKYTTQLTNNYALRFDGITNVYNNNFLTIPDNLLIDKLIIAAQTNPIYIKGNRFGGLFNGIIWMFSNPESMKTVVFTDNRCSEILKNRNCYGVCFCNANPVTNVKMLYRDNYFEGTLIDMYGDETQEFYTSSLSRQVPFAAGSRISFNIQKGKPLYHNGTAWVDATGTPV